MHDGRMYFQWTQVGILRGAAKSVAADRAAYRLREEVRNKRHSNLNLNYASGRREVLRRPMVWLGSHPLSCFWGSWFFQGFAARLRLDADSILVMRLQRADA